MIATENVHLMERMSKIMSSSKQQGGGLVKTIGKHEALRKRETERVNIENKHMLDRLESVPPVLSSAKLEQDFVSHLKDVKTLSKKRNYIKSPSPTKQHVPVMYPLESFDTSLDTNSIGSIAEFRSQFIGKKKENDNKNNTLNQGARERTQSNDTFMLFHKES
jgi:hypothetical protein